MSRGKNLIKNTGIYFIGTFGSKLLSYMLLPLYANYLTQDSYGEYDLISTIIQLVYPIITLMLDNAMYTFLIHPDKYNREEIISFAVRIFIFNSFITTGICFVISRFITIRYFGWIVAWIISVSFYNLMIQICRGYNRPPVYSASGVILTAITLVGNIVGIVVLKLDYLSLIISNVIALLSATIFLEYKLRIIRSFKILAISHELRRKLLLYSIPLIPNTVSWWVLNVSDRLMITYYIDSSANGVYAMASKIPAILTVVHSIFSLAWADDIMTSKSLEETSQYANSIYNKYISIMIGMTAVLVCGNRLIFRYAIGGNFVESYRYTYFLYLGCICSALASCLGAFYGYRKKSVNISIGSGVAAAVNVIVNFFFIPVIGVQAASISTFLGFLAMWLIRLIGLKNIVQVRVTRRNKMIFLILIPLYFTVYIETLWINILFVIGSIVFAVITNRDLMADIFGTLKNRSKENRI